MIEEIDRDIYRIAVPLEGSPLGSLNAYYFRGSEAEYLMDTGFRTPQCESALRLALDALGWHPERLNIVNTHLHMDHTGLNHRFVGARGSIYIGMVDYEQMLWHYKRGGFKRGDRDRREGADAAFFESMLRYGPERDSTKRHVIDETRYVGLHDGQALDVGPCTLRMVAVPGHTPGKHGL